MYLWSNWWFFKTHDDTNSNCNIIAGYFMREVEGRISTDLGTETGLTSYNYDKQLNEDEKVIHLHDLAPCKEYSLPQSQKNLNSGESIF